VLLFGGVLSLLAMLLPRPVSAWKAAQRWCFAALAGTAYLAARFGAAPAGRAAAQLQVAARCAYIRDRSLARARVACL